MVGSDLVSGCWCNNQLHQIDPKLALTAQQVASRCTSTARIGRNLPAWVVCIHPAITIHRHTHSQVIVKHVVVAEFRNQKILGIAVSRTIKSPQASTASFTPRTEQIHAQVETVTDKCHRGRVVGAAKGVIRHGRCGAAHTFGFHAVTVREIAIGGIGAAGQTGQSHECEYAGELHYCLLGAKYLRISLLKGLTGGRRGGRGGGGPAGAARGAGGGGGGAGGAGGGGRAGPARGRQA